MSIRLQDEEDLSIMMKKLTVVILLLLLLFQTLPVYGLKNQECIIEDGIAVNDDFLVEWGEPYYSADEVALYLYAFAELPPNYITKEEAMDLGWINSWGNLWEVTDRMCIGGDRFANRERSLPVARGRVYYECDVNYYGGYRGGERLVFSSDGLIYYTGNHYADFELLYDGWYEDNARYRY